MTRFSYGASLQAKKVSHFCIRCLVDRSGRNSGTHSAIQYLPTSEFSERDIPSNLTSDLADKLSALGQETLPPRDPGSGGPWGDLCSLS
jgi:hypothetical protein